MHQGVQDMSSASYSLCHTEAMEYTLLKKCPYGSQSVHARPAKGTDLKQLRAMLRQVLVAQRDSQPAIPHKLPAGIAYYMAAGERPGDVSSLTEVVRIVQRVLVHHLCPVNFFSRQPLTRLLRNAVNIDSALLPRSIRH